MRSGDAIAVREIDGIELDLGRYPTVRQVGVPPLPVWTREVQQAHVVIPKKEVLDGQGRHDQAIGEGGGVGLVHLLGEVLAVRRVECSGAGRGRP